MINIIIFNKNYSRFIPTLFESLKKNNTLDNSNFMIHFYDDGSSDDSRDVFQKTFGSKYLNVNYHQLTLSGNKRKHFCYGQIDAVIHFLSKGYGDKNDLVCFLDSDDHYPNDYFDSLRSDCSKDGFLSIIRNVDPMGNFLFDKKIARKIPTETMMWPSITNTSGICLSYNFLFDNKDYLLTKDDRFSDLWLDSRVNILLNNKNSNISYMKKSVRRVIHTSSDSNSNSFKRKIKTQISAVLYTKSNPNVNNKNTTLRFYFLELLSKFYR